MHVHTVLWTNELWEKEDKKSLIAGASTSILILMSSKTKNTLVQSKHSTPSLFNDEDHPFIRIWDVALSTSFLITTIPIDLYSRFKTVPYEETVFTKLDVIESRVWSWVKTQRKHHICGESLVSLVVVLGPIVPTTGKQIKRWSRTNPKYSNDWCQLDSWAKAKRFGND